jgi:hypothetical protein
MEITVRSGTFEIMVLHKLSNDDALVDITNIIVQKITILPLGLRRV